MIDTQKARSAFPSPVDNTTVQVVSEVPEEDEVLSKLIRILVVEDQEVLRLGLRLSLVDCPDILIVGEATDGPSAVRKAMELKPTLILMDIGLPEFDGVVATKKIKAESEARILVLTSHSEDKAVFSALAAGADGYCLKDASREKLLAAIRSVAAGGTWLSDDIAVKVLRSAKVSDPEATNQHCALSSIELEVLNQIFAGATVDEIAKELEISSREVLGYTTRVLQKVASKTTIDDETTESGRKRKITNEHVLSRICARCYMNIPLNHEKCPYDGSDAKIDELIGTIFADRYEILAILGSGTGGTVYKARHRFMQKLVAIKIMHGDNMQDLDLLRRFRQEAAAASALQHPNIVSVVDFGFTDNGESFMIMDYLDSVSLSDLIDRETKLRPKEAIKVFIQVCDGLSVAHQHGIIHRDLKPSNVLVSGFDSGKMVVRLADFGIAKLTKPLVEGQLVRTEVGQVFGSPLYMSPEQCKGLELDATSDIYSMGCLMYETLVGHPPVVGKNAVEVMYKKANEPAPHIGSTDAGRDLPRLLQEVIMKALRYDKDRRYKSVDELREILHSLVVD